jgi:hypothetical protein
VTGITVDPQKASRLEEQEATEIPLVHDRNTPSAVVVSRQAERRPTRVVQRLAHRAVSLHACGARLAHMGGIDLRRHAAYAKNGESRGVPMNKVLTETLKAVRMTR